MEETFLMPQYKILNFALDIIFSAAVVLTFNIYFLFSICVIAITRVYFWATTKID